jgi:hypothetical protein
MANAMTARYSTALARLAKLGDREWTIADGSKAFRTWFADPFVKRLIALCWVRKPGRNRYLTTKAGSKAAKA